MKTYKHALSITSQVPFCSVPLRLDVFDKCQFSCSYCFAKARGGSRGNNALTAVSASALKSRFKRVFSNQLASALDEMLLKRVPIQLGGMTDPFSQIEAKSGIALEVLNVLADFDYPTLISTKSVRLASKEYLAALKRGNFYVRVSFTGAPDTLIKSLEKNVPTINQRLELVQKLSEFNIPTSGRIQPLILDADADAINLIHSLGKRGARHISVEYLKWPVESGVHQNMLLGRDLPEMQQRYIDAGARLVGREYVLPAEIKLPTLLRLREAARLFNMEFGFADNDLLHLNQFNSCCNAGDLFLRNAHYYDFNILSAVKRGLLKEKIIFSDITSSWKPNKSINNYLNSSSRPKIKLNDELSQWENYLKDKWNSSSARGGPASFWGCVSTNKKDEDGNIIFTTTPSLNRLLAEFGN